MARPIYQRVAVTDAGDVIPGAEYTVTNENTGTEQTIYDARSGGSVISQPAFADANGVIQFWTEPGVTYRVEATGGVGTYTDRYVEADTRMADLSDPASGSLMPPGAFGLGGDATRGNADLNLIDATGFYDVDSSDTNKPGSVGGFLTHLENGTENGADQRFVDFDGAGVWSRAKNGGVWSSWKRLDPQAFGLGLSPGIVRFSGDLDTILTTAFYNIDVSACTNFPTGAGDGNLICQMWDSIVAGTQLFIELNDSRMYMRRRSGSTWQAWQEVYNQSSILGTVSQSGGVPTGSIIEADTNANGEYVKFADGTLITKTVVADQAMVSNGQADFNVTLPAAHVNLDFNGFAAAGPQTSTDVYGFTSFVPLSTSNVKVRYRNGATAQNLTEIVVTSYGRWF